MICNYSPSFKQESNLASEYELYNYSFFEYNGQWYAYNESELHKSECTYFKVKYSSKTPATSLKVGSTFKVTNNTDLRCEQTEIDVSSVTWVTTNDNIQLISNETHQVNSSLEFKAVKKGKTTIYCISSTGVVKEITVTIK